MYQQFRCQIGWIDFWFKYFGFRFWLDNNTKQLFRLRFDSVHAQTFLALYTQQGFKHNAKIPNIWSVICLTVSDDKFITTKTSNWFSFGNCQRKMEMVSFDDFLRHLFLLNWWIWQLNHSFNRLKLLTAGPGIPCRPMRPRWPLAPFEPYSPFSPLSPCKPGAPDLPRGP